MRSESGRPAADLRVHAAGSLRAPLTALARRFEVDDGAHLKLVFGAAGLLKERLLAGEASDVFASANLAHPQALAAAGRSDAVRSFARNTLCVLAHPAVAQRDVVAALLDPALRVGISTPEADPSGDYALQLFERIESSGVGPAGSAAALKARAMCLTGHPRLPKPAGHGNVYGKLVELRRADLFVTYRSNAVQAQRERPALQVLALPPACAVWADYGVAVLHSSDAAREARARRFAEFLRGPVAQAMLAEHGFVPCDPR